LQLLEDVRHYKAALQREGCGQDAVMLSLRLSLVGYQALVRTAIGGGQACFKNLRHEFISVRDGEGTEYIVDPAFRDHFQIPHPTRLYQQLLAGVPAEFVGTSSRLVPLVQCLCMEMSESFSARSLTLPPWRRSQAMLSKWLPARCRDTAAASCCSGASDSEGASPDSATDHFNRISELQVTSLAVQRINSKGLLSNRLSAPAAAGAPGSTAAGTTTTTSSSGAQGVIQQRRSLEGLVSKQAPVHWSLPPSYTVKPAAAAAAAAPSSNQGQGSATNAATVAAVGRLQRHHS
jgi:uncharacterized protein (TIGR01615 family)